MKLPILLALTAAVCGIALAEDKQPVVFHVDPAAAEKLLADGKIIVLDVRTPSEFSRGHIAGAKNIDFNANDFAAKAATLDRSQSYIVHCAAGGRSTNSLPVLEKLGFISIYHLDGGFNGWQDAGKPVVK